MAHAIIVADVGHHMAFAVPAPSKDEKLPFLMLSFWNGELFKATETAFDAKEFASAKSLFDD
jgi:hypothetical protein